ncbi:protein of unknown function (DUF1844) [Abditibacterium utsteinense]|uniref:DUF1844 domain-containing protein n=1 Tax=Abditibacterium utsteinense TaxID=1960156 RepID=A0A2S8SX45_9BACT|nr:DUF1844 domain-containing protein [Abditibacterium utsteinense]PQV65365.1 protein of unknown function (DUF1844) [Abditibacterium utsteinense]
MANDREEREREEREASRPKIIDNRMLSEEERTGKLSSLSTKNEENQDLPKLEIIGGRSGLGESSLHENAGQAVSAPSAFGDASDATETTPADGYDDEAPMSEDEQFAALEEQFGRPLTEGERAQVRAMNGAQEEEEAPLSPEEESQMRSEIEQEQFAALEQQFGRALTEEEKTQVRTLMEQQRQSMMRLEVAPLLLQSVTEIPKFAAVHLGLVANPYTGIIARDDAEARLAIDAFGAMYEVLKTRIDARTGAELARVLNDLRANYTRVTGVSFTPGGSSIITGPRIIR